MRSARIKDVWKAALNARPGDYTINNINFTNVRGIGDRRIIFPNAITAICGENGVGKTTLLKAIFAALVPSRALSYGIKLKPQDTANPPGALCEITAKVKGEDNRIANRTFSDSDEVSKFFDDDGEDPLVSYVDGAANAQRIMHLIGRDADFSSLLEGAAELTDPEEVRDLRREVTGRNYSSVVTYEMDDYADLPVFPYFKVTVGNITYGSEEMGLGELCANYLLWVLYRCRENSLILLEEPESHLPPRAQERLMAHVAEISVKKKFKVIVSTHSQHTLANIPASHISFLGRNNEKLIMQQNPDLSVLYASLKISTSPMSLLIVEDHSAFAMLKGMIEKYDPSIFDRVDFTWKNGFSFINEALALIPRQQHGKITLLGIYDGDQRNSAMPADLKWPYVFLPGDKDPIYYLVAAVRSNVEGFARLLKHNSGALELAVANFSTSDIKDFFLLLRDATRIDLQLLYDAAAELWLSDSGNDVLGKEFIESLNAKLF